MVRAGAGSASAADLLHSRATPTNPPPHVAGERLTFKLGWGPLAVGEPQATAVVTRMPKVPKARRARRRRASDSAALPCSIMYGQWRYRVAFVKESDA